MSSSFARFCFPAALQLQCHRIQKFCITNSILICTLNHSLARRSIFSFFLTKFTYSALCFRFGCCLLVWSSWIRFNWVEYPIHLCSYIFMCVLMYSCVGVCSYVFLCVGVCSCVFLCHHLCSYMRSCVFMFVHVCLYVFLCVRVRLFVFVHVCLYVFLCVRVGLFVFVQINFLVEIL